MGESKLNQDVTVNHALDLNKMNSTMKILQIFMDGYTKLNAGLILDDDVKEYICSKRNYLFISNGNEVTFQNSTFEPTVPEGSEFKSIQEEFEIKGDNYQSPNLDVHTDNYTTFSQEGERT